MSSHRPILAITWQTLLILRRDKVLVPIFGLGLAMVFFITLISQFTIEDILKLMFDFGTAGLNITGSFIAIIWANKLISDDKTSGAVSLQLAAPIARWQWLVGKFLGLGIFLSIFGAVVTALWLMTIWHYNMAPLAWHHAAVFGLLMVGWWALAAAALLFAVLTNQAVALFSSFGLWMIGLVVQHISSVLGDSTPALSHWLVEGLAQLWNLQHFNVVHWGLAGPEHLATEVSWRIGYGLSVTTALLITNIYCLENQDL